MAGVARLRLDTADRQHRFTGHMDQVTTQRHGEQRLLRKAELSRPHKHDLIVDSGLDKETVDPAECQLKR